MHLAIINYEKITANKLNISGDYTYIAAIKPTKKPSNVNAAFPRISNLLIVITSYCCLSLYERDCQ